MRKRQNLLIASGCAVMAAAMVAWLWPEGEPPDKPEPTYNGTPLSEWLGAWMPPAGVSAGNAVPELAVRAIGTNALPLLLEWIRYELPPRRARLLRLATFHSGDDCGAKTVFRKAAIEGNWARKAEMAEVGFIILSTNGASAVPELEALMRNNQKPELGLRAIWALRAIGAPAIPALTNALADIGQTNRQRIIEAIYGLELDSAERSGATYKGASLPALSRALSDPDKWIRREAHGALFNLALHGLAPWTFTNASSK